MNLVEQEGGLSLYLCTSDNNLTITHGLDKSSPGALDGI